MRWRSTRRRCERVCRSRTGIALAPRGELGKLCEAEAAETKKLLQGRYRMETYSADALPAASRAIEWNDLYSRQLNRVEFTPEDRHSFAARLSLGRLGPIQFVRMSTNRTDIRRTRRHIVPGAPRLYSFLLQARGSSVFQHCGQEAHLAEGDFTLCDSAAPHSFSV